MDNSYLLLISYANALAVVVGIVIIYFSFEAFDRYQAQRVKHKTR